MSRVLPKAIGTRKFTQPQAGMDQRVSAKPVSRCEWAARSRKDSNCAAASKITTATIVGKTIEHSEAWHRIGRDALRRVRRRRGSAAATVANC